MDEDDLRERVAALEERVAAVEATATDAQGREWTVGDLVGEFGLTRRQALAVFGLLVGGYPLYQALVQVASAGTDEVGTIGGASAVVDAYLEDVYDKNGNQPLSLPGDGSVNIDSIGIRNAGTIIQSGSNIGQYPLTLVAPPSDITSTSFADMARLSGFVDLSNMPSGATLYGRMVGNTSVNSGETMTIKPSLWGTGDFQVILDSLATTISGTNDLDSGEVAITETLNDNVYTANTLYAKVSGGTGSVNATRLGVLLYWRVD